MRVWSVAALAALALVAAGCGASRAATTSAAIGTDAATLVPADALAFVSIDTDRSSQQRSRLDQLTSDLPVRAELLDQVRAALSKQGLDYSKDVEPALGSELDIAVLKIQSGKPEAIALARPDDESKLAALAAKFDTGTDHYTVQRVGSWSVVADSADAFAAVRNAESGTSLADTSTYTAARQAISGNALLTAFVAKGAIAQLPQLGAALGSSAPDWVAANIVAQDGAVQLEISHPTSATENANGSGLLGDVPSGAILAVSFRGSGALATRLQGLVLPTRAKLGVGPRSLAPLAGGDGVLYLRAGGLVPIVGVELRPKDPERALAALRALAAKLGHRAGGTLTLITRRVGDRVFLADSPQAIADLRGSGAKLVGDAAFKDALAAAGGGRPLVYADVHQLLPFAEALAPVLGAQLPKPLVDSLSRLGTVVVAKQGGAIQRLVVRITRS